jgi:hypothetical protein
MYPKIKRFEDSVRYDYAVCEIEDCVDEAVRLGMTETRYVDFCDKHYTQYIVGEK